MVKMPFERKQPIPPEDIAKLIDKGGAEKENQEKESKKHTHLRLRIPISMVEEIDNIVEENFGLTRTGWILQTLQKELKRINTHEKLR